MSKKANLASALADIGGSTRKIPVAVAVPPVAKEQTTEKKVEKTTSIKAYQQPGREGTKPITGHFPKNVRDQLKILAVENDTTLQKLLAEAFNDLFAKYGKPEIAPKS